MLPKSCFFTIKLWWARMVFLVSWVSRSGVLTRWSVIRNNHVWAMQNFHITHIIINRLPFVHRKKMRHSVRNTQASVFYYAFNLDYRIYMDVTFVLWWISWGGLNYYQSNHVIDFTSSDYFVCEMQLDSIDDLLARIFVAFDSILDCLEMLENEKLIVITLNSCFSIKVCPWV